MKIFLYAVFFVFLFFGLTRLLEKTSIFYPSRKISATPADIGLAFEDVFFKTEDGLTLNGWLLKTPGAESTLLFLHGNAGNISDRLGKMEIFHNLGLNVFIFDYRGYGKSTGVPSEKGIYQDAVAAWDYLAGRKDLDMERIVLYGASLGGAVAVHLAEQRKPAALIIDSSFPSARDMAKVLYPTLPGFFITVQLDSSAIASRLTVPKLFFHSIDDEVVPYRLGRKLFEVSAAPKEFVEITGSHNDGHVYSREKFVGGIRDFLIKLKLLPEQKTYEPVL